jgi:hypothetical protein
MRFSVFAFFLFGIAAAGPRDCDAQAALPRMPVKA